MVTTIRLPDELHRKLREQAERKGMTVNAYVLGVLWEIWEQKKEIAHRKDVQP